MIPYNPLSDLPLDNITLTDSITVISYEAFVCNLIAPMADKDNIHHMATGIAGEAGELLDNSKKTWVYGKKLDRENMIEELGDLEWYMAGLRQMLGVSRREVLDYNVKKLGQRYQGGFSSEAAIARADKNWPAEQALFSGGSLVGKRVTGTVIMDDIGQPIQSTKLHIIDMAAPEHNLHENLKAIAQGEAGISTLSPLQQAMDDEEAKVAPVIQDWCLPLLAAYHADKTVTAIAYSKSTATVLFRDDPQPYKLYRPKGEV